MNKEIEVKIIQLLNSDVMNYLETSEKLVLKNLLDKEEISELQSKNLSKIIEKYGKFIKN